MMNAASPTVSRVLTGTLTAPARAAATCAIAHEIPFGIQSATWSPTRTPRSVIHAAKPHAAALSSPYVSLGPAQSTATVAARIDACSATTPSIVVSRRAVSIGLLRRLERVRHVDSRVDAGAAILEQVVTEERARSRVEDAVLEVDVRVDEPFGVAGVGDDPPQRIDDPRVPEVAHSP